LWILLMISLWILLMISWFCTLGWTCSHL